LEPGIVVSIPDGDAATDSLGVIEKDWLDQYLAEISSEFDCSTEFDWATCTAALDVANNVG